MAITGKAGLQIVSDDSAVAAALKQELSTLSEQFNPLRWRELPSNTCAARCPSVSTSTIWSFGRE